MPGRDAMAGPRATSQASPRLSGSLSSEDRERASLRAQLAAWRERRDQRKPAAATSSPKPFRPTGSNGPSDAEKQKILQRRREIMRSPSGHAASPQVPAKREAHAEETKPREPETTQPAMSGENLPRGAAIPPPRTPPPRDAGAAGAPRPARAVRPPLSSGPPRPGLDTSRASDERSTPPPSPLEPLPSPTVKFVPSPLKLPPRAVPRPLAPLQAQQKPHLEPAEDAVDRPLATVEALPPPPSPAGSPQSSETTLSSSLGGRANASPVRVKQVRFADDAYLAKTFGEEERGTTPEDDEKEPSDPLADSHSSVERDMRKIEQLMLEADELIFQQKQETTITDHILHCHIDAEGHDEIEEAVFETRVEDSTVSHLLDFTPVDEHVTTSTPEIAEEDNGILDGKKTEEVFRKDSDSTQSADSVDTHDVTFDMENEDSSMDQGASVDVTTPPMVPLPSESVSMVQLTPSRPRAPVSPAATQARSAERRRRFDVWAIFVFAFAALCLAAFSRLYPQSPVSRCLRVAVRVAVSLSTSIATRFGSWFWRSILQPCGGKLKFYLEVVRSSETCKTLQLVLGDWVQKASTWSCNTNVLSDMRVWLRSLVLRVIPQDQHPISSMIHCGKEVLDTVSTWIAHTATYLLNPFMKPLAGINSTITQHKLRELEDVPQQLQHKVNELLRAQEKWALDELKRMKDRRVAYAAATKSILAETSKAMLKTVQEAKLTAAEHIQEFTNRLTVELMESIQPELEQYERLQADQQRDEAVHEAKLKKTKLEEAARLEILRVELAKRQASSALNDKVAADRVTALEDKVSVKVDVMEIVETVDQSLEERAMATADTIVSELKETVDDLEAVAEVGEAILDVSANLAQQAIKVAEDLVTAELVEEIETREQELTRVHDIADAEIMGMAALEVQRLEEERLAAERLAQSLLAAEGVVARAAEEGRIALGQELVASKKELESELLTAKQVAIEVEKTEVEEIVVEQVVVKEGVEVELVEDVVHLVERVEETKTSIVEVTARLESELEGIAAVAESVLDQVVAEEAKQIRAEQFEAEAELNAVASTTKEQIGSIIGVANPELVVGDQVTVPVNVTRADSRLIAKEGELRDMMLFSVGFVVLAIATAFALYPRWRRLVANPGVEAKRMHFPNRRRRRRSWQRPVEVSDSEPEEVTLLQTGSPSDDGLSDTNEPEPEVVEQMNTPQNWRNSRTTTSQSSYSSYARTLDFSGEDARAAGQDVDDEEDALASPTPTRRLRRRRG